MTTHRYIDLSTGHVSREEMEVLEARDDFADPPVIDVLPRVIPHRHGAWVNVPAASDDEHGAIRAKQFPSIQAVITYARAQGASWINLDAAGDTVDELPEYSW